MHARVSTIEGSPDRVDEGTALIRSKILPELEHVDGFAGVLSLADRVTGRSLTITLWETEDALRASEERANAMRSSAATDLGATADPSVERFEVTLSELRQPAHAS